MPIFDFECPNCHTKKEEIVSTTETEVVCECGTKMEKKFPTTTAIRFGDTFVVGRYKESKDVSKQIEEFKKHPEKDPYGQWRDK